MGVLKGYTCSCDETKQDSDTGAFAPFALGSNHPPAPASTPNSSGISSSILAFANNSQQPNVVSDSGVASPSSGKKLLFEAALAAANTSAATSNCTSVNTQFGQISALGQWGRSTAAKANISTTTATNPFAPSVITTACALTTTSSTTNPSAPSLQSHLFNFNNSLATNPFAPSGITTACALTTMSSTTNPSAPSLQSHLFNFNNSLATNPFAPSGITTACALTMTSSKTNPSAPSLQSHLFNLNNGLATNPFAPSGITTACALTTTSSTTNAFAPPLQSHLLSFNNSLPSHNTPAFSLLSTKDRIHNHGWKPVFNNNSSNQGIASQTPFQKSTGMTSHSETPSLGSGGIPPPSTTNAQTIPAAPTFTDVEAPKSLCFCKSPFPESSPSLSFKSSCSLFKNPTFSLGKETSTNSPFLTQYPKEGPCSIMSISAISINEDKSHEELRLEYYLSQGKVKERDDTASSKATPYPVYPFISAATSNCSFVDTPACPLTTTSSTTNPFAPPLQSHLFCFNNSLPSHNTPSFSLLSTKDRIHNHGSKPVFKNNSSNQGIRSQASFQKSTGMTSHSETPSLGGGSISPPSTTNAQTIPAAPTFTDLGAPKSLCFDKSPYPESNPSPSFKSSFPLFKNPTSSLSVPSFQESKPLPSGPSSFKSSCSLFKNPNSPCFPKEGPCSIMSFSAIPINEDKSHEELRLEYYLSQGKVKERDDTASSKATPYPVYPFIPVMMLPSMAMLPLVPKLNAAYNVPSWSTSTGFPDGSYPLFNCYGAPSIHGPPIFMLAIDPHQSITSRKS